MLLVFLSSGCFESPGVSSLGRQPLHESKASQNDQSMQVDAFLLYIVTNAFMVGPNMTAPESDTPGG